MTTAVQTVTPGACLLYSVKTVKLSPLATRKPVRKIGSPAIFGSNSAYFMVASEIRWYFPQGSPEIWALCQKIRRQNVP